MVHTGSHRIFPVKASTRTFMEFQILTIGSYTHRGTHDNKSEAGHPKNLKEPCLEFSASLYS